MAKKSSSKLLKSSPKTKLKVAASEAAPVAATKKSLAVVPEPVQKAENTTGEPSAAKKVSQKLLETIEKRKKLQAEGKASGFARPPGRRGRRPKALAEYTPANQEEDMYSMESEYEGLEYDTGIRVKEGGDDRGFSLDRFDDFDEELNFDR